MLRYKKTHGNLIAGGNSRWHRLNALVMGALLAVAAGAQVQAEIAQTPLAVSVGVPPNILLAVDDSASMDAEILVPTNDGALWWHTEDRSFVGRGRHDSPFNFNEAGLATSTWKRYVYLLPNGVGTGRRVVGDGSHAHFAIPPIPEFAFARSPSYNTAYFNPRTSYEPWVDHTGERMPDADPGAAPTDPVRGTSTFKLTASVNENACVAQSGSGEVLEGDGQVFMFQPGMTVPTGTCFKLIDNPRDDDAPWGQDRDWQVASEPRTVTRQTRIAFEYFPASFYLPTSVSLPLSLGYDASPILEGRGPQGEELYRYDIRPANFATGEDYERAIQNFANWFTYHRKRHAATRGAVGSAFQETRALKVGSFATNNRTNVTMRDLRESDQREAFYNQIYSQYVGSSLATPNRQALQHAGNQLRRTDSAAPVQYACQYNATFMVTDGYSDAWTGAGVGNVDGGRGEPYADSVSNTMADIAKYYYVNRLRTGSDFPRGRVPVPTGCSGPNPDPRLNCNSDLHMMTYGLTLGMRGDLFNPENPFDPWDNPPNWPTSFVDGHPSAIDDLWHATINTRGALFNAGSVTDIQDRLEQVLNTFIEDLSSASSIATNSTRLDTDTLIYQARFDTSDWSGELVAYEVGADGSIGTHRWRAEDHIPSAANRKMVTFNPGSGNTINFTWNSLTDAQRAHLAGEDGATIGERRLNWLRGSAAYEVRNGGTLRDRRRLLADIVHSDPLFVQRQDFGYTARADFEDDADNKWVIYDNHVAAMRELDPMLYVGANDGKLHAFNAETGREIFAYVPNMLFHKLEKLTRPNYPNNREYYLDGSPRVGDAFIGGQWRRLLVGSLGAGGKGVYALDITDPANPKVMWEITNNTTGFGNLGHVLGQPTIAATRGDNPRWVVSFGNGYGSTDGRASLFFVDAVDGSLIRERVVDSGPNNGLSAPVPIDVLRQSRFDMRSMDRVYAGDLKGNLWRFTVDQNAGLSHSKLFQAIGPGGNQQPITVRPQVARHPEEGMMVYFGTGKFFEVGDDLVEDNPPVQTFYGLHDDGNSISGRSQLFEQKILAEVTAGDFEVRVTSSGDDDATATPSDNDRGWFIDLVSPVKGKEGERVAANPVLRSDRIIFTTLIPSEDPCDAGGTGWLMEMNARTGSRLAYSPFDIDGDGRFDEGDFVYVEGIGLVPVSGKRSQVGIIRTPGIISAGDTEFKYTAGSTGELEVTVERGDMTRGRQSWRQLR
jgi:type IV pilus assembly protein PilY1